MATPDISGPSHSTQTIPQSPLAMMTFTAASAVWHEQHSSYVKPNTAKGFEDAIKRLQPCFGKVVLADITIDHMQSYRDARLKEASTTLINAEFRVLQMILRTARLWKSLEWDYSPLPVGRHGVSLSTSSESLLDLSDDKGIDFDAPPIDYGQIRAEMTFTAAATAYDTWMSCPVSSSQARYRARRTTLDIRTKMKALDKFFGPYRLEKIGPAHLREYQKQRFSNQGGRWAQTCGANKINAELMVLMRILKLGNAYSKEIEKWYQPLQVDECEIPKALTPDEQERFLRVAASRPEWEVIHWYALLALHIAWSSDEMRTLRQGNINLAQQIISVDRRSGKNKYRRREAPITDPAAMWALEQLLQRSINLVGRSPEFYVFPFRICRGRFDGSRHTGDTGFRKYFEEIRIEAELPQFRFNQFRHTAITRMAEAGIPIAVIMARAGHTCQKMTNFYTHISQQAERLSLQRMGPRARIGQQQPWSPAAPPRRLRTIDDADIQAEIDRRVALALEKIPAKTSAQSAEPMMDSRLITFPGGSR